MQYSADEFLSLLKDIQNKKSAILSGHCDITVTGDINFSQTNWETVSSPNDYETQILEKFKEYTLAQHANTQLDVVLCDRSDIVVTCHVGHSLIKKLTTQFSNHCPYISTISAYVCCKAEKLKNRHYAFSRANWSGMNDSMREQPFTPYCFSHVNKFVEQWYDWIWEKVEKFVTRVTSHRSKLQPWTTGATSHFIKKLETTERSSKQVRAGKPEPFNHRSISN